MRCDIACRWQTVAEEKTGPEEVDYDRNYRQARCADDLGACVPFVVSLLDLMFERTRNVSRVLEGS